MRRMARFAPIAACVALSACGGSGGGVNSTPAPPATPVTPTPPPPPPPPPPPAATNTTLTDLRVSQTFTNDSATSALSFDRTTNTTVTGRATSDPLTIRYDAPSNSYTVTSGDRAQTFGPGDVLERDSNQVRYRKTADASFLTLVTTPFTGSQANRYVGLGFLQNDSFSAGRQDTQFSTFTYGLDTPATGVPRTGTAGFDIDVFGLVSVPGNEPRVVQGRGLFSTDFGAGVFSSQTFLEERGLITGSGVVGGGIELTTGGRLGANGTFAGNMLLGSSVASVAGAVNGRFYGPAAEELGASFSGANPSGATVTGSFTGQRNPAATLANLTLTNLTSAQLFYPDEALLTVRRFDGRPNFETSTTTLISQLNRLNSETFSYGPGRSDLPGGNFTINDKVASADPNFVTYRKTFNGQDVELLLSRPGAANTQLALTYASLGRWSTARREGVEASENRVFFTYGLRTPAGLLAAKTGTGTYVGIVYGAGANASTGSTYDVTGTSRFDVDFGRQSYSGALALRGAGTNGTPTLDFGSYDFSGRLAANLELTTAPLTYSGTRAGELLTRFYGPDGQEIAGTFTAIAPPGAPGAGTALAGATAATRR